MKELKLVNFFIYVGLQLLANQCPKTLEEEEDMSCVSYASAIRSFMYVMVFTRFNIAHAMGELSKYISKVGKEHQTSIKRVFRDLCGTIGNGLY